jgi:hypothetical protein
VARRAATISPFTYPVSARSILRNGTVTVLKIRPEFLSSSYTCRDACRKPTEEQPQNSTSIKSCGPSIKSVEPTAPSGIRTSDMLPYRPRKLLARVVQCLSGSASLLRVCAASNVYHVDMDTHALRKPNRPHRYEPSGGAKALPGANLLRGVLDSSLRARPGYCKVRAAGYTPLSDTYFTLDLKIGKAPYIQNSVFLTVNGAPAGRGCECKLKPTEYLPLTHDKQEGVRLC